MNLVPTPRTDVNGKTTIRHMKPMGATSNATTSIAAPAAAANMRPLSSQELDDYVWDLSDRLGLSMAEATQTLAYGNLEYLSRESPDLFAAVDTRLENADEYELAHWKRILCFAQFHPMGEGGDFDYRAICNRHLETIPFTRELLEADSEDPEDWALQAHSFCAEALRPVLRHVEQDDYATMKAAMIASWAMPNRFGRTMPPDYRTGNADIDYIAAHVDEVMRVRTELKKRNTIDRDVVEVLINSASVTLAEGAL